MRVQPIKDINLFFKMQQELFNDKKIRELLLLQLMFYTNLRVSDALKLKWKDVIAVDEDDNTTGMKEEIYIKETKTKKKKWIPMMKELRKILWNFFIEYHPSGREYIFRSASHRRSGRNEAWYRDYVYKFMREYAKKVGIKTRIGSHTPRKTWAYHAYHDLGIDIYEISRILNHSNVRTTEVYIGLDHEQIKKTYDMVAKLNEQAENLIKIDRLPPKNWKFHHKKRTKKKKK